MAKTAVIIYGANGSGKGTQADLLAKLKGFVHFDTGKIIERILHDPSLQGNKIVRHERKIFDAGILNTPSWVLKEVVSKNTKKISQAGLSIVFSGSPRTLYETFGDKNTVGLIATLEKEYGKKNIKIVFLKIKSETAIKRNTGRMVCSVCATPVLAFEKIKHCPICSGKLKKRIFDNPEKMKIRLQEFHNRTMPIIKELKKRGYKIMEVDAEPRPFEVFAQIQKKFK